MKNQLYRTTYIREVTLNNGEIIRYENSDGHLKYGEIYENIIETSSWEDFLHLGLGYDNGQTLE